MTTTTDLDPDAIRRRLEYHLCCMWAEDLRSGHRPTTKGLRVGVASVVLMLHASWPDHLTRGRPVLTEALAAPDDDMAEAMLVALVDCGFNVAERRDSFGYLHLACNARDSAIFERPRGLWRSL